MEAQQRVGNKWSEIARLLPGRAENAVKNRFNSLITRRLTNGMHSDVTLAQNADRVDEFDDNEDANIESKSPQEILALMFRRIGESNHIATRIPVIRGAAANFDSNEDLCEYKTDTPPLSLKLDTKTVSASSSSRVVTPKNLIKSLDHEQQYITLAHRFWSQERMRNELFQRIAFTTNEWDDLEAKAVQRASEHPNDVAAAAAAATAALGENFLPPKQVTSPQLCQIQRQDQGDATLGTHVLPDETPLASNIKGHASTTITGHEEVAAKLTGTMSILTIDGWPSDIADGSLDQFARGLNTRDFKVSWSTSSPHASQSPPRGNGAATQRNEPTLKLGESVDDWGAPFIGSSFAAPLGNSFGAMLEQPISPMAAMDLLPTNAPATAMSWRLPQTSLPADIAVRTSLQDTNMRQRQNLDPVSISDTSMSIDNVDWDLILKMSSTPKCGFGGAGEQKVDAPLTSSEPQNLMAGDSSSQHRVQQKIVGLDQTTGASGPSDESELTPRARQLLSLVMREQRK